MTHAPSRATDRIAGVTPYRVPRRWEPAWTRERTVTVSGVVLAGGASRRFGRDKRAEPVAGVPLLRRAVDAVTEVSDDVVPHVRVEPQPRD